MTSILAFAWRKSSVSSPSSNDHRHQRRSTLPLSRPGNNDNMLTAAASPNNSEKIFDDIGVTSSSSGETLMYQPSSDSQMDVGNLAQTKAHTSLEVVGTPDGLKIRKSPEEIRQELGLAPKRLLWGDAFAAEKQKLTSSAAILPPMMAPASKNRVLSPQISTSSFYSMAGDSSIDDNVARSPSLRPGEARTAVGALLAMNEDIVCDDRHRASSNASQSKTTRLLPENSILPSREWLRDDRSVEDNANDFSIELPYESLNESLCSVAESSIHSIAEHHPNLPNTSFTKGFLEYETTQSYDFGPLVNKRTKDGDDESAPADISSYMSQPSTTTSTTNFEIESMQSMGQGMDQERVEGQSCSPLLDYGLRETEDLIVSVFERLRDDNGLVATVLLRGMGANRMMLHYSSSNGGRGTLMEFSSSARQAILKSFDGLQKSTHSKVGFQQILAFYRSLVLASSPGADSQALVPSTSHSSQQQHRWRAIPGFRSAIGLDELPNSPATIRGGDTSLFSLPSETATPHTSNVSMTSTITTAISPEPRNRYRGVYSYENSEQLSQSLQILCMGLESLGEICRKLADMKYCNSSSVHHLVESMHDIYEQLMLIPKDDLKTLIDSFEMDILDMGSIARMVSADDDVEEREIREPLPFTRSSWGLSEHQQGSLQFSADSASYQILEDEPTSEERDSPNIFSPTSQDMRTIEIIATPESMDDDLRRIAGSFDSGDDTEEREGPPALELQRQAMRGKRPKKKRKGFFNRRLFRRRKAAE